MGTVYALSDPRNPALPRYIGQTAKPLRWRLNRHYWNAKTRPDSNLARWVMGLYRESLMPRIYALETCPDVMLREREISWIRFFKPLGLLNLSDGPGMLGMKHPLPREVYERASATRRGRKMPIEQKRRWSAHPSIKKLKETFAQCNKERSKPIISEDGLWRFHSMKEASRCIKRDVTPLSESIKHGRKCSGVRWKYGTDEDLIGHLNPFENPFVPHSSESLRKVTNEGRRQIFSLWKSGVSQSKIARDFKIDQGYVSRIIHRIERQENANNSMRA